MRLKIHSGIKIKNQEICVHVWLIFNVIDIRKVKTQRNARSRRQFRQPSVIYKSKRLMMTLSYLLMKMVNEKNWRFNFVYMYLYVYRKEKELTQKRKEKRQRNLLLSSSTRRELNRMAHGRTHCFNKSGKTSVE